jgi:hypothetical protein
VQTPKSQAVLDLEETGIRGGGMILLRTIVMGLEEDLRRARAETNDAEKELDGRNSRFRG